MEKNDPIGLFDSGIGGLTTLYECTKILPYERFVYYADNAAMPYGNKSLEQITQGVVGAADILSSYGIKSLVMACNTATSAAVLAIRKMYDFSVLGIEPAIKPAAENFAQKKIVVLCTKATSTQQKFYNLLQHFQCGNIVVLPQSDLASKIEHSPFCDSLSSTVKKIFSPHLDAEAVVLGCTHYIYIKHLIEKYFAQNNKSIAIFDGNNGVARHLKHCLDQQNLLAESSTSVPNPTIICTKAQTSVLYQSIFDRLCAKEQKIF